MRGIRTSIIAMCAIGLLAGRSVGVAAQDEGSAPAAPVAVTATTAPGPCPDSTLENLPGNITRRSQTCVPTWEWSDERLNGTVTRSRVTDTYHGGVGLTLDYVAMSIENDAGGWQMRPLPQVAFPDAPAVNAEVYIMDGFGGYEGLTAVLLVEDHTPHGFIIDGDMPPVPENASTQ